MPRCLSMRHGISWFHDILQLGKILLNYIVDLCRCWFSFPILWYAHSSFWNFLAHDVPSILNCRWARSRLYFKIFFFFNTSRSVYFRGILLKFQQSTLFWKANINIHWLFFRNLRIPRPLCCKIWGKS